MRSAFRITILSLLVVLAPACSKSTPSARTSDPRVRARDAARAVLEAHCGQCHREDQPTAQARALAVFNLNELEWAVRMTDQQQESMLTRVNDNPDAMPASERARINSYLEIERARKSAGDGSHRCIAAALRRR
jgi:hypothetical protein